MAKILPPKNTDVSTYATLFRRVKETLLEGQRQIEAQKVQTYWDTGRLIQAHILLNKGRADYGTEVVLRLEADLKVSKDVLHRCIKFFKSYPDYRKVAAQPLLSWSHYKQLFVIADEKEREKFADAVESNGLSEKELRARIKASRPEAEEPEDAVIFEPQKPLVPTRGELYTYKIIKPKIVSSNDAELVVDLGFSIVRNVDAKLLSAFSVGDIVESRPKEDAYKFYKGSRTQKNLYTYSALVERVIDGDTLKVSIDLGFDTLVRETLRLRGIDCPELGTKSGDEAKAYVQSLIKEADKIVIRSYWSDKYGRYLADIFLPGNEEKAEVYLNNLLLEKGHAIRFE